MSEIDGICSNCVIKLNSVNQIPFATLVNNLDYRGHGLISAAYYSGIIIVIPCMNCAKKLRQQYIQEFRRKKTF